MRLPVLKARGEATGRSPGPQSSPPCPAQTCSHLCLNDRLSIPTCLCLCSVKIMSYKGAHHKGEIIQRRMTGGGRTTLNLAAQCGNMKIPSGFTCSATNFSFPDSHARFIITEHLPSSAGGARTLRLRKCTWSEKQEK